jgi:hypothetical protein
MKYLFAVWSLLFVSFTMQSMSQPRTVTRELPEPPRPSWMESDKELQALVSLDVSFMPLHDVLVGISRQYKVNIQAERELGDYRVSLHAKNQPVNRIMGRLQDLFGHGTLPNRSYEWSRIDEGAKQPVYYLRRNRRAIEEEEALLDVPRQTCLRWLKELQSYLRLSKEEQAKFQAECPCLQASIRNGEGLLDGDIRPLGEAFAALTDGQVETLMQQGSIDLPNLAFSPEAQGALQKIPDPPAGTPTRSSSSGQASSGAVLRLEREGESDTSGVYFLSVNPHNNTYCTRSFIFDTQRQLTGLLDTEEMQLPPKEKQGPVMDLLAHRQSQTSGNSSSLSLETALRLLAEEAGIDIYAEVFPRWPIQVDQTKGTPEQLLTLICAKAGYRWRKVGRDFLVYSRSWAQDRQANVPQPLLDRWQASYAKNGRHVFLDLLEMARLKDEQIRNLIHWIDIQAPLSSRNLGCLRLVGKLAPNEVRFAYDSLGVNLVSLDLPALNIAQKEFRQRVSLPIRVFIRRDPDQQLPDPKGKPSVRKSLTITLQDQSGLIKKYLIIEPSQRPRYLQE